MLVDKNIVNEEKINNSTIENNFYYDFKKGFENNSFSNFTNSALSKNSIFYDFKTRYYFVFYGFSGTGKDSFLDIVKKDNEYYDLLVKIPSHTTKSKSKEDRKGEFVYVNKQEWKDEDYFFVYENEKKIKYGYKKEDVLKVWNSFTINPFLFKNKFSKSFEWNLVHLKKIPVFIVKESEIKRLEKALKETFDENSENKGLYFDFLEKKVKNQNLLNFKIHFKGDIEKLKNIVSNHKDISDNNVLKKLLDKEIEISNSKFFYDKNQFTMCDEEIDMIIDGDFIKDISVSEKSKDIRNKVKFLIKKFIKEHLIKTFNFNERIIYYDYNFVLNNEEFKDPKDFLLESSINKNLYLDYKKSPLIKTFFLTWLPWEENWEKKQKLFSDIWKNLKFLQHFVIFNVFNKIESSIEINDYYNEVINYDFFKKDSLEDFLFLISKKYNFQFQNNNLKNKINEYQNFLIFDKNENVFNSFKEQINFYNKNILKIYEEDVLSKSFPNDLSQEKNIYHREISEIKNILQTLNFKVNVIQRNNDDLKQKIVNLEEGFKKSNEVFNELKNTYPLNNCEDIYTNFSPQFSLFKYQIPYLFSEEVLNDSHWKSLMIQKDIYNYFDKPENLDYFLNKYLNENYLEVFNVLNELKTHFKRLFNYLNEEGQKLFIFEFEKNNSSNEDNKNLYEKFDFLKFLDFVFSLKNFYIEYLNYKKGN